MTLREIEDDIKSRIGARYNAFYLAGVDDEDAEDVIAEVANGRADDEFREWSYAYGPMFKYGAYTRADKAQDFSLSHAAKEWLVKLNNKGPSPSVFIIRDVHLIFESAQRGELQANQDVAALKMMIMAMLYHQEKEGEHAPIVFLVGLRAPIPPMIERLLTLYDVAYPREDEIRAIIKERIDKINDGIECGGEDEKRLTNACRGLGRRAVRLLLNRIYEKTGLICYDNDVAKLIYEEKKQEITKSQVLRLVDVEGLTLKKNIGGLEELKSWLEERRQIISDAEKAKRYHVDTPKGVMIVGMPGCGKSVAAKATAVSFNLQLLQLDMGSLMGKYVGESEANMRRALQLAEAASPCVLWLDEIEKAFSGVSANGGGSEIATRLYGYFLTWMQEKKEMVFVIATANRIDLPPELFRRGRFDDVFYVDFPNRTEAEQIVKLHLKKRSDQTDHAKIDKLDISKTLDRMYAKGAEPTYAGADLESVACLAVERRYLKMKDTPDGDCPLSIEDAIDDVVRDGIIKPIGATMKDEIKATRNKFTNMGLRSASKN